MKQTHELAALVATPAAVRAAIRALEKISRENADLIRAAQRLRDRWERQTVAPPPRMPRPPRMPTFGALLVVERAPTTAGAERVDGFRPRDLPHSAP